MRLIKYSASELEHIYGIEGKILQIFNEPVHGGYMIAVLHPKQDTRCHRHHEHEKFVILKGYGLFINSGDEIEVTVGDVIELFPGDDHVLKNNSDRDLIFTSLWWNDASGADITSITSDNCKGLPDLMPNNIIFAPPATPNGELHLGHLAGPYIGADIMRKFLEQNKTKCCYITGSDDNQSYVSLKSYNQRQSNKESVKYEHDIASEFSKKMQDVYKHYNLYPDYFYRPASDSGYQSFVKHFITALYNKKWLKEKTIAKPFCNQCNHFLYEATLQGKCSYCSSQYYGLACEECGLVNNDIDVREPKCRYCNEIPVFKECKQLYFLLPKFTEQLKKFWAKSTMPAFLRTLCRNLVDNGLKEIPVSQHCKWGIEVPIPGFENQVIDSWIEMAPAYLYAACNAIYNDTLYTESEIISAMDQIWFGQSQVILFFGFDNSFCYTTLLPALLMAYNENIKAPNQFISNYFYQLEDQKFSKSRNHVIWAKTLIDQGIPIDAIRYYLAYSRPETKETSFVLDEFKDLIKQDMLLELGDWMLDLDCIIKYQYEGFCPEAGEWQVEHDQFLLELKQILHHSYLAYQCSYFSPSKIIELLRRLVSVMKKLDQQFATVANYLNNYNNQIEYSTTIVLLLTGLKYYAMICYCIMPDYSCKLANALGMTSNLAWEKQVKLIAKDTPIKRLPHDYFELVAQIDLASTCTDPGNKNG